MISDTDTNIMELCFHNGEQHMKEKVINVLMEFGSETEGIAKFAANILIMKVKEL